MTVISARRNRRRRTALLAAAIGAAVSLTACGAVDSTTAESADSGVQSSPVAAAVSEAPEGTSGKGKVSSGSAQRKSSGSSARTTCTGANTEVTAQTVARPINHLLLTVTNTGSKTCDVYGYPALKFTDAQAVPPVIEDSQPQAVLTLAPGESGYAGVTLSSGDGSGEGGYRATTLSLYFQDRNLEFTDEEAQVALPAKGVYIDSSLRVTYWQADADTALTW